jgi:hypothetical protein
VRNQWSWLCKISSRLSVLETHATPSEQQKALICGYLSTSLLQSLNLSCNKSSAPKLYLDLRPYSQNTVHKFFSRVVTVAFFTILLPLHRKCSKSCLAYFDKNVTCCTKEKYFSNTQGNRYFCTGTKLRIEGGIRQILGNETPTYYQATIYHRHLITPTNYHTVILSQRHLITPTFYQRQIITLQIKVTLNTWKQAFPVWEIVWEIIILGT